MDLVFLHGPAASGKLTTARAIADLVGFPVFHNHLVVDALTTVFSFGSEPFVRLRERFWLDVFAGAADTGRSLIFTFAPEPTVGPSFIDDVRTSVESRGGRVRFVELLVGDDEQERRVANADRRQFHKLADVDTLRGIRARPSEPVVRPPAELVVDTEAGSAAESGCRIVQALGLVAEPSVERFPPG